MSAKAATDRSRAMAPPTLNGASQATVSRIDPSSIELIVKPGERLIMAEGRRSARCETIRALRTELLLRRDADESSDMIVLLSPCAGEGRSLLAADLALSVAQTGCPTLLVDADLRNPHQHVLFGTHNRHGLSQAIAAGERPRMRAVQSVPAMSLLTAGEATDDPLELLSSLCFKLMIDEWREGYKFVVIDAPPISQYSDGLVIANRTGRVLLLSRAQHTPHRKMKDMLRRLASTRSEIQGAVISHF
jgi:receptor protein-tyrosine kinase